MEAVCGLDKYLKKNSKKMFCSELYIVDISSKARSKITFKVYFKTNKYYEIYSKSL